MLNLREALRQPVRGAVDVPYERIWRAVVAELIGTMFFAFIACASVVVSTTVFQADKAAASVLAALAQGFTITAMVAINGKISGGHINPAVTFCLVVVRSLNWIVGLYYIIFQCVGAVLGAALFEGVIGSEAAGTLGATVAPTATAGQVFLLELVISSLLMYTVLGTALHAGSGIKPLAPIPIGFAVTVGVLVAAQISGGSMNPARSFGPAVIANVWKYHYLYWVSPLLAALLVGLLYKLIFLSLPLTEKEVKELGIDLGTSQATLSPNQVQPNEGRMSHYLTAAQAIDMSAGAEAPISVVTHS